MKSAGLDPTLGAILPILGVIVGAALGGLARHILDQRAQRAALTAAVRVVRDDLRRIATVLEVPFEQQLDPVIAAWLVPQGWPEIRLQLARLDDEAWKAVTNAVNMAAQVHMATTWPINTPDAERIFLQIRDNTKAAVARALVALADL
jgi:hypothetical protein